MFRQMLRTLAGLAMLWGAWNLHTHSMTMTKEIISPPPPVKTSDLPPDPLDVVEQPAQQTRLEGADALATTAFIVGGVGGLLALSGIIPLLIWALFGRFPTKPEEPKPEPPDAGKGMANAK